MVVLRDIPTGCNWGWFAREDQRMHIQTVNRERRGMRVWLETDGHRTFVSDGPLKASVEQALRVAVTEHRDMIDAMWISFMITKGWLRIAKAGGPIVALDVYPFSNSQRTVQIDILEEFPNASTSDLEVALDPSLPALVVGASFPENRQNHIDLVDHIWL